MSDVMLSAAVRQNLVTLQSTANMMSKIQNRLSTGLKVTSALDNPNSFFTAQSLNNRSGDMSNLLDDMGQSIQALRAADEGIMSITKLVEAAKAKANQALQTTSVTERAAYAAEYNELLTQIEGIATDAGYNGKNLLSGTGNDVTVKFNEKGTNTLAITAIDYTDTTSASGLNIADVATTSLVNAASGTVTGLESKGTADATTAITHASNGVANVANGDVLTLTDGVNSVNLTVGSGTTYGDVVIAFAGLSSGASATFNVTDDDIDFVSTVGNVSITSDNTIATTVSSDYVLGVAAGGLFETDASINSSLSELTSALATLRSQASTFGTNLTVVENRQSFTKAMINTLEEGAGKLILADTNMEGANLLALQTRQQLASTSLSFASQADQNVLRLF